MLRCVPGACAILQQGHIKVGLHVKLDGKQACVPGITVVRLSLWLKWGVWQKDFRPPEHVH